MFGLRNDPCCTEDSSGNESPHLECMDDYKGCHLRCIRYPDPHLQCLQNNGNADDRSYRKTYPCRDRSCTRYLHDGRQDRGKQMLGMRNSDHSAEDSAGRRS